MEAHVKNLIQKRATIKGQITSFKSFLEGYTANSDVGQLTERLTKIRGTWTVYDEIQTQLETYENETDRRKEPCLKTVILNLCRELSDIYL